MADKPFSFETLPTTEVMILGVLGFSPTALSTQDVYEGVLFGEAWSYFQIIRERDQDKAISGYTRFSLLIKNNKEKEAIKLVEIPLSNYNTVHRHLEFLKENKLICSKAITGKKQKKVWYLPPNIRKEVVKELPKISTLKEALKNFYNV